jgi:hypothetical protein
MLWLVVVLFDRISLGLGLGDDLLHSPCFEDFGRWLLQPFEVWGLCGEVG